MMYPVVKLFSTYKYSYAPKDPCGLPEPVVRALFSWVVQRTNMVHPTFTQVDVTFTCEDDVALEVFEFIHETVKDHIKPGLPMPDSWKTP